ncbi:MAG: quinone oxidoreductase [Gammaproteobacteria bacterium]|nr:quinone oxidoreductase [Gammaproteobacteria bacterium]
MSEAGRIEVAKHGAPEVLRWRAEKIPPPAPDEIRVRHTAVGVNFIDVYFRTGLYPPPQLPFTPGLEAAGVVEEAGAEAKNFSPGDRVAYASAPLGAYCEMRNLPAARAVKIPDGIDDATAAAVMLKGMTAHYLLHDTYCVRPGDAILFHAAAGGVGLIACQWAKHLGARVIGTAGSEEKAELAREHGCEHVIDYTRDDWPKRVREITGEKGVPVVYDSVGQATFAGSLDCLRARGTMVSFGQSSGAVAPFDIGILNAKGALFLTRPSLAHYTASSEELAHAANAVFDVVASGAVRIHINQRYPLKNAADAHRDLEARRTTGCSVLLP